MAHRTNVTPVAAHLKASDPMEIVTDPNCGMQIRKKDSKSLLFRKDETYYFCSKTCQQQFTSPKQQRKSTAA
jgi:YHS domain-containing protein